MNSRDKKSVPAVVCFLLGLSLLFRYPLDAGAGEKVESEWGGQIKAQGFVSREEKSSLFAPVGTGTFLDGNVQFRINNDLFFSENTYFTTHYEAVISGGDRRRRANALDRLFPGLLNIGFLAGAPVEDDRRFFDFTKAVSEDDRYVLYHRLDRFFLGLQRQWGALRVGRQAVTWGNGLLFNPMDLVNPFSPTDIERDYKIGDDMVNVSIATDSLGELQFLYLPRRDPATRDLTWNESSLAGKLHLLRGTNELDVMAAKHFRDAVVGAGSTGYLGDAAWRLDATLTFPGEGARRSHYLSLVANIDYSWDFWGKNWYGVIELYYNGLGNDRYALALADPAIAGRLDRGDLFVLGRTYLSGHVRVELHPLFNLFLTAINNIEDPSGILQPRAIWDVAEDVQVTVGGNVAYGEKGTEFGGFEVAGTGLFTGPPDSAFLWLTYYF